MRLATLRDGTADGVLAVVASDGMRAVRLDGLNLLSATENWNVVKPRLADAAARLAAGEGQAIGAEILAAPLPRSWQWLDGSAFPTHGNLMQIAFNLPPIETDRPLMYQGLSDRFYGPFDDVTFPDAADGIDFEGEFGVIVDAVPRGITADEAMAHILLVVQINDWSLRAIAPKEMKTGFGWIQAKPACSMAPFAVTTEELGDVWDNGRVCLDLEVTRNGQPFGHANGREMEFGFHDLIAHAARTRDLVPGTIIGSGTVSNTNYAEVGSSCISEARAIEIIAGGAPVTQYLDHGETVEMTARTAQGLEPFGTARQKVLIG